MIQKQLTFIQTLDLFNSFLDGVKGSGLSEDFKLHVVQGDNKIDFNIAIKAHKGLPSDQKDTILKRVRALRAPDFGAANTWIYNSFDLDLKFFIARTHKIQSFLICSFVSARLKERIYPLTIS